MRRGARAAVACGALLALAGASGDRTPSPPGAGRDAAFVDPLDAPAIPSALAPRAPIAAVTRAGGRLVAAGQRGHVLWSDDGGGSWSQAAVPVSTDLTAVHFPTPSRGFAVGHDGVVLSTADGGRSWTRRLDGRAIGPLLRARYAGTAVAAQALALADRAPDLSLLAVWFADASTGFVVGAFDLVLRTDDGGESWTPWLERLENPRALHLHAVGGAAGAVLLAGEQGLLLRLDAAAARFRAVPAPPGGSLFGLAASGRDVVAFGLGGRAVRSGDGGETWEEARTGVDVSLAGGTVLPDGRLALVSQAGRVLVSDDGGRSFRGGTDEGPAIPATSLAAADARTLVLAGPAGLRRARLP